MKRIVIIGLMLLAAAGSTFAQEDPTAWLESRATLKVADLTLGDLAALAQAASVQRQNQHYVMGATRSSFILPGIGQFKTGSVLGGSLRLTAFLATIGGTAYGVWTLLPADLKASGLSRDARHERVMDYMMSDPAKIAPAAGVMAGGLVLALAQSLWAASDAQAKAIANLQSGQVVFEPVAMGAGFGMRMRF